MRILEMIAKWREGCSFSKKNPLECTACTETLINNIENYASVTLYSGCITPELYKVVRRLHDALTLARAEENSGLTVSVLVGAGDLESLLHEFFRLDNILRLQNPRIPIHNSEEDHRVT